MKTLAKLFGAALFTAAAALFITGGATPRQPQPQNGAASLAAGAWTQAAVTVAGFPVRGVAHGLDGNAGQVAPGNVSGVSWASVSAGAGHTVAITTTGELWAWGDNFAGQLGLGDSGWGTYRNIPTRVGSANNWTSVAAGEMRTLAITANGELWAWGSNLLGRLGLGDDGGPGTDRSIPTRVDAANNWASASLDNWSSVAITTNGELWAWGQPGLEGLEGFGELNINTPTRVGTANNWASVSVGGGGTMAITTNGELWAWGNNGSGELGLGDNTWRNMPTRVGYRSDWVSVSTSSWDFEEGDFTIRGAFTLAVTANGELWAWGSNFAGQLGLGDSGWDTNRNTPTRVGDRSDWVSVSTSERGRGHSFAVTANGELWAWGSNGSGELGLGDNLDRNAPTRVGSANNWASVAAGSFHTVAITTTGELWAWGGNGLGELGLGDSGWDTGRNTPTRVGGTSN